MSKAWANGSTRRWRRIRQAVLHRDGYACRAHTDGWCNANTDPHTCLGTAPLDGPNPGEGHHTLGRQLTGDDPNHIVASCAPCNKHIGDPTAPNNPPIHIDPAAL